MISRSSLDDLKPLHLSALVGWPIFFVHESRHRAIEVFREIQAHQICLCRYLTLERLHMQSARAHALLDAQGRVSGNFGGDPASGIKVLTGRRDAANEPRPSKNRPVRATSVANVEQPANWMSAQ